MDKYNGSVIRSLPERASKNYKIATRSWYTESMAGDVVGETGVWGLSVFVYHCLFVCLCDKNDVIDQNFFFPPKKIFFPRDNLCDVDFGLIDHLRQLPLV